MKTTVLMRNLPIKQFKQTMRPERSDGRGRLGLASAQRNWLGTLQGKGEK